MGSFQPVLNLLEMNGTSSTNNETIPINENSVIEAKSGLKDMKIKSPDKVIIGHLNINSIRNKFDTLSYTIENNIDILLISETKLDDSYPSAQFSLNGFKEPYRYDRNSRGGGLLLYVRDDIPSKNLRIKSIFNIELILIEINLRKRKWLLCGSYNPHRNQISNHLECLNNILDEFTIQYENIILLGDFNVSVNESSIAEFCSLNNLVNLIDKPTCYKNFENPTSIDLILTNRPTYFQHTCVLDTNISDFHLLTVTEFKMNFQKMKPKIVTYRDYKKFDNDCFRYDISKFNDCQTDLNKFLTNVYNTFERHAPIKKRYVRANNAPFMNKELHKEIMKRSRLRNKFLKTKTEGNREIYKTQRNYCKKLLKYTKKSYFANLDKNKITDNRVFWKTVSPFFTEKSLKSNRIILNEEGKNITLDDELCKTFKDFFSNVVDDLNIPNTPSQVLNSKLDLCSFNEIFKMFEVHPSITAINDKNFTSTFSFNKVSQEDIMKVISEMDITKTSQNNDTPTKIIKYNKDIYANFICSHFNSCLDLGEFPEALKNADVIPIYKKKEKSLKENYRPVSILSNISKIYEKLMFKQLYEYFEKFLLPSQCGFRKGFSVQHCLIIMIEKFKQMLDKGNQFGALFTDLSKAFDCLDPKLLIGKLNSYGVSLIANKLIYSYLNNRTQRIKINDTYSERFTTEYGVPQGSVLGPLLFNIYIIDLFYVCEGSDIVNYADDTTPYACGDDISTVITKLQSISTKMFYWFESNHLKANPGKSHLLLSSKYITDTFIDGQNIQPSKSETLLGVIIDSELNFEEHVTFVCKKVSGKLSALGRIATFLTFENRRKIFKAFIESQFNYCPLIWMQHSRKLNNKINRIHERALRYVYFDYSSSFKELLERDNSFTIHHKNVQSLAIEIYKFVNGLSPDIMSKVF